MMTTWPSFISPPILWHHVFPCVLYMTRSCNTLQSWELVEFYRPQFTFSFLFVLFKPISGAHWPIFKSILVEGHSVTTLSITLEGFSFPRHLLAYQTVSQAHGDMFHSQDAYSCKKVGEMSAIGHHNSHHSYIAARPDVHMSQVHSRPQ